jgi:acetoin utilization deacetylase AcuC-like enzyme
MLAYYADAFVLPLPPDHRFPMRKYSRLRERVVEEGIVRPEDLRVADPASDEDILRVHTAAYWHKVKYGTLSAREQRRIGFPWSAMMVERTRRVCGGTIGAATAALHDGAAVNLAGGTHHGHADFGSGYCVTNDVAVATRALQARGLIRRAVVIDCDVHQGDGTAAIFHGDTSVFTFSIHGAKNFPFHKQTSDLDIELPDGTGDDVYLAMVEEGTRRALAMANADIAFYIAGADPYVGDRLGKMAVSMAGLAQRDEIVLGLCRASRLPVAVVMGGGYAHNVEDIAAIHTQTVRAAARLVHSSNG